MKKAKRILALAGALLEQIEDDFLFTHAGTIFNACLIAHLD